MELLPTYIDILASKQSKIFESSEIQGWSALDIKNAELAYTKIYESLVNNTPLDEGILGSILGGTAGAIAGPAMMKAICKALGLEKGALYDLLTSRLVLAAVGAQLGYKL